MKLLITNISPASCYILLFNSKYSPQYIALFSNTLNLCHIRILYILYRYYNTLYNRLILVQSRTHLNNIRNTKNAFS
jgi:hypothetical protein